MSLCDGRDEDSSPDEGIRMSDLGGPVEKANRMNNWQATADRLGGISRTSVYALWRSGALQSVKIGHLRFSTDKQIDMYVARLESEAAGAA